MTNYGNPFGEVECMFEQGIYLYVLYCLCFVNDISMDMLEDQSREDGYLNIKSEEEFIPLDGREKKWKYGIVKNN